MVGSGTEFKATLYYKATLFDYGVWGLRPGWHQKPFLPQGTANHYLEGHTNRPTFASPTLRQFYHNTNITSPLEEGLAGDGVGVGVSSWTTLNSVSCRTDQHAKLGEQC